MRDVVRDEGVRPGGNGELRECFVIWIRKHWSKNFRLRMTLGQSAKIVEQSVNFRRLEVQFACMTKKNFLVFGDDRIAQQKRPVAQAKMAKNLE